MTTLQEAARKALEALESMRKIDTDEAIKDLRTALAQQVERKNCPQPEICGSKECEFCRDTAAPAQKPVAYITDTWQGPMVWTPEMYGEACTYCDDGEFPVPLYTAAPAPQPAQDVPEVGFGNIPTKFLANGTRFKLSFDMRGKVSSLWNFMDELDGRWVALVAAENDCHLQSAQPVAQPLSDSEIEKLREKTFSTYNPYCPVDSKSMRKAVRAAEAAHGIGEVK